MHKFLILRLSFCSACLCCVAFGLLIQTSAHASAGVSGSTTTVQAGAYVVDITLSKGTPLTDQPLAVTVIPHDHKQHLEGEMIASPGLGTDAANIYANLYSPQGKPDMLSGSLRLPVRGAWQITVKLQGPYGAGEASVGVVAAAPGAMPVWVAWSIGAVPFLGLLAWSVQQYHYRRRLVLVEKR